MAKMDALIPEIVANEIQFQLRKNLVYGGICNKKYEGIIKRAGDVVHIPTIANVTIAPYTPASTDVTPEGLTDAAVDLEIDQSEHFAFLVEDIDNVESGLDVLNRTALQASYGLMNVADAYIAGLYGDAGITSGLGTTGTPLDIDSDAVIDFILAVQTALKTNNAYTPEAWMVVPPWLSAKIVKAGLNSTVPNQDLWTNGFIGRVLGFNMYESNNVQNDGGSATTKNKILAGGSLDAISFAGQILTVEKFRPEKKFADALKGLYVFGAAVTQAASLACATVSFKSET